MAAPFIKYIANAQHYDEVFAHSTTNASPTNRKSLLTRIAAVKHTLWIGTADIKDVYVMKGKEAVPLLSVLEGLVKKGVEIRLIHAKEPGQAFREDHEKFPKLWSEMERALCPRVHFKIMIFDMEVAYIGSANLTGAGIGMKGETRRNFEAGILTNDHELVESAVNQFDDVWRGAYCKKCGRKEFCKDRISNK